MVSSSKKEWALVTFERKHLVKHKDSANALRKWESDSAYIHLGPFGYGLFLNRKEIERKDEEIMVQQDQILLMNETHSKYLDKIESLEQEVSILKKFLQHIICSSCQSWYSTNLSKLQDGLPEEAALAWLEIIWCPAFPDYHT